MGLTASECWTFDGNLDRIHAGKDKMKKVEYSSLELTVIKSSLGIDLKSFWIE